MLITEVSTGKKLKIQVDFVENDDYKIITKKRHSFNWKDFKKYELYKLTINGEDDILGLIAIEYFDFEERIEIKLLTVSQENRGKQKKFDRIAGNMIAFAARLAIKKYGPGAAISLVPKTLLGQHYMDKYGFKQAGVSLYLVGGLILNLLKEYSYE